MKTNRVAEYPIHEMILNRWSARAMSGEPLSNDEFMRLFEAARWAPSSRNNQLWRFIYARKGDGAWNVLLELLAENNQRWCKKADVLVVIVSRKIEADGSPNRTHSFSAGSAFENLALQGTVLNLVVHPMGGFDHHRARTELDIPDDWEVDVMVAIGKPGDINMLDEKLRAREMPSQRKPLHEFLMEGRFRH